MSLPLQDQANILHGIRGGWTMRSEIINALLIRGRGTLDRIESSELRDIETPSQNNAIRVLAYTGHKWIVDPDPI